MILPDPAYQARQAAATAGAMRRVLLLLYRDDRTRDDDAALLQAAQATWEGAALSGQVAQRISAGLLLAQVQRALGQNQAVVDTAERVRRLARGTPQSVAATVRALAVGAQAWRDLAHPDHAEHLLVLAQILIETTTDPADRHRIGLLAADVDRRSQTAEARSTVR